ncbi:MAG: hypothetical protein TREMPRED_000397 [Tremellales sp. Tagirdzhanova-0007]|nr:MAG: hypothetical protein TREMPRED_000397 [Tremellales sp. Tagirdzhanova-0007]
MRIELLQCIALILFSVVDAIDLRGNVVFDVILPNATSLSPSSKVLLGYGSHSSFIRKDGSFEITNVQDGQHVLEPLIPGYTFLPLLVTVSDPIIHIQSYHPARRALPTSIASLPHPIQLRAAQKEDYFISPPGMNLLGMVKNPMVLMMLFSAVMMFAMPKIMASINNMDPELSKEMAETRKRMQGMQNMDFMGNISNMLAGGSDADPAPAASLASGRNAPSKISGAASNGGKRRKGR